MHRYLSDGPAAKSGYLRGLVAGFQQTLIAIRRGRFREARRWVINSRKQTVRSVGQQGEGMIWVTFGVDDPGEPEGYFIWARYTMKREKGSWVINGPSF